MASTFNLFEREIKLATADLEPAAIRGALAAYARQSVAEVISSRQAPPDYERFVNGRAGAPEESVQLPGPIVYLFTNWGLIIDSALEELRKRVPHRSGDYARSFIVTVGGRPISDFSSIPPGAEVIILNAQPYTRKMETGANGTGRKHFDLSKAALNRRFYPSFQFQVSFLNVSSGLDPRMPYVLKGSGPLVAAKQDRRSSAFRAGRTHLARGKDREAGAPITYPALVITAP